MKELKSIVYKQGSFNQECLKMMAPLFRKRIPFHLEELRLIDLKTSSLCCEALVTEIAHQSYLKKLALVNV
jgi:hypothetical protein